MKCELCGTEDLLMACQMGPTCAVCTMRFFNGGQPTAEMVSKVRKFLGLPKGEYLKQDVGAEAAKILNRRRK